MPNQVFPDVLFCADFEAASLLHLGRGCSDVNELCACGSRRSGGEAHRRSAAERRAREEPTIFRLELLEHIFEEEFAQTSSSQFISHATSPGEIVPSNVMYDSLRSTEALLEIRESRQLLSDSE